MTIAMRFQGASARACCAIIAGLLVAACGSSTPEDSVEALTKDPDRLKVVRRQCRDEPAALPEKTCRAASEAVRRRFYGDTEPSKAGTPRPERDVSSQPKVPSP
jgi:hypothetical protein